LVSAAGAVVFDRTQHRFRANRREFDLSRRPLAAEAPVIVVGRLGVVLVDFRCRLQQVAVVFRSLCNQGHRPLPSPNG
jgi:hypothetical protein